MGQSPSKNANSTSSLTTTNGHASSGGVGVLSEDGGDDPSSGGCSGTSAHFNTPQNSRKKSSRSKPRRGRSTMSFDHDFSIDNASAADFMSKSKKSAPKHKQKTEIDNVTAVMGEVVISRPYGSESETESSESDTASLTSSQPISIPSNELKHSKFLTAKKTPPTVDATGSLTSNITSEGSLSATSITSVATSASPDRLKMSPPLGSQSSESSDELPLPALKSPVPNTHVTGSKAKAVVLSSNPSPSTPQRVDLPAGYQSSLSVSIDSVTGSPTRNIRNGKSIDPAFSGSSVSSTSSTKKKQALPFDINDFIKRLLDAGVGKSGGSAPVPLRSNEIIQLCAAARSVFMSQPVLLELGTPVKVVGDIHGQFGDLIRIFQMSGFPPKTNYLFLGDYVDRGRQSLETILLLLCFKVKYPENFFMLRGNHECASITKVYGFYDECKRRATTKIWKSFVDTFNTLPIAATIGGKIFCVHGGLSPHLNSMDDIRKISRPTNVPDVGLLSDLLWSDPERSILEWSENDRGVSYCFGRSVVNKFCTKFKFDLVCRAHMVVQDGYEFFNKRKLVTLFSAPNYCGEFDNWGAVMCVSKQLLCSFELLKPMDSASIKDAVRRGIKKTQKVKLGES